MGVEPQADEEDAPLGYVSLTAKDSNFGVRCDGLACTTQGRDGTVQVLSAVGSGTTIKALAAGLHASHRMTVLIRKVPGFPDTYMATDPLYGYSVRTHRLGFDSWHMLAITKQPGFMPVYSVRAMMGLLLGPNYSTPILKGWGVWLAAELRKANLLGRSACFGCTCGSLVATNDDIDALVSRGLRDGHITINKESAQWVVK